MKELLIAIVSCLIGGIIGHWLSLGRDRRKEHNEVVLPIKKKVLEHLDCLNDGSLSLRLNESDIKSLRGIVNERQYKKIKLVFAEYKSVLRECVSTDDYGQEVWSENGCEKVSYFARKLDHLLKIK